LNYNNSFSGERIIQMQSLYDLLVETIIRRNIVYPPHYLPTELQDNLKRKQIQYECGKIASTLIQEENNREYVWGIGYEYGIQRVYQHKHYISMNVLYFEREYRRQVYNCGHFNCPYIAYYLKQEPDFNQWFNMEQWKARHCCEGERMFKRLTEDIL
jgi:hypothetical protein